jgi:hypothetical protein
MTPWVLITALQICPGISSDAGELDVSREACPHVTEQQCAGGLVDDGNHVFEVTSCLLDGDRILVDFDAY